MAILRADSTVGGKPIGMSSIYIGDSAPTEGDYTLWINSTSNMISYKSGTEWVNAGGAGGGVSVGTTAPDVTKTDVAWIDTSSTPGTIKYSNGTAWVAVKDNNTNNVYIGSSAPTGQTNLIWVDTANSYIIKAWSGSAWVSTGAVWK